MRFHIRGSVLRNLANSGKLFFVESIELYNPGVGDVEVTRRLRDIASWVDSQGPWATPAGHFGVLSSSRSGII